MFVCLYGFYGGGRGEKGGRERKHLSGDLLKSGLRHFTSEIVLPQTLPIKTLNWAEQQERQLDNFFLTILILKWLELKYLKICQNHWKKKKQKKTRNPVSGPSGREHPHVKYSLLLLIVAYCSCNFQASSDKITQWPEIYVTSHKHNVRLI